MLPFIAIVLVFAALWAAYMAFLQFSGHGTAIDGWQARFAAMGKQVRASSDEAQRKQLQARLVAAGLREPQWLDLFVAAQLFAILVCAIIGLGIASATAHDASGTLLCVVASVAAGYFLPLVYLDTRADGRRHAISRSLPSVVDLLTSTMEAGLSVEQSIERVTDAIVETDPLLADEMTVTVREIAAGIPLDEAMRRLGRRVGLEELQALCAVIAQASLLGARVAQTLRDYADAARRQRIATLEERAGKLSARLTMPIVICLLPACLLMILAPAIVEAVRVFGEAQ